MKSGIVQNTNMSKSNQSSALGGCRVVPGLTLALHEAPALCTRSFTLNNGASLFLSSR